MNTLAGIFSPQKRESALLLVSPERAPLESERPEVVLDSNLYQGALCARVSFGKETTYRIKITPRGKSSTLHTPDRVIDVSLKGEGIGASSKAARATWVASTEGTWNLAPQ